MTSNTNLFVATGTIDGAVDFRTSKAGKPYARFTLISARVIRDTAEDATVPCVCFGPLAERVAANAKSAFYVAGRLKTERWEYQGRPCQKLVLQVDELRPLGESVVVSGSEGKSPDPVPAQAVSDTPPF